MRVLAIGDIHGCAVALDTLLDAVKPRGDDLIVTLGDYVDRGPRSRDVIEKLIALDATGRLVAILGNHDQMMLDARDDELKLADWSSGYGKKTLASYTQDGGRGSLDDVPAAHWRFLESVCRDFFEIDTHFFVHANAYPDQPLSEQPMYMLRWETFDDPRPTSRGRSWCAGTRRRRTDAR